MVCANLRAERADRLPIVRLRARDSRSSRSSIDGAVAMIRRNASVVTQKPAGTRTPSIRDSSPRCAPLPPTTAPCLDRSRENPTCSRPCSTPFWRRPDRLSRVRDSRAPPRACCKPHAVLYPHSGEEAEPSLCRPLYWDRPSATFRRTRSRDSTRPIAHRPSPIAHRPSPIAHRPSPIAHRPSPIAHLFCVD